MREGVAFETQALSFTPGNNGDDNKTGGKTRPSEAEWMEPDTRHDQPQP